MKTDAASSSSSSSDEAETMVSDSEDSSTHTSPDRDIHHEPPSRSVFSLKPRALTIMKDITSPPNFPAKRPFKNSVEEDNPQKKKMKVEEGKAQNGDRDAEKPRNDPNKQLSQRSSGDYGEDDDEVSILKGILDYYSKNGVYPFANSSALHDFLKNSLQVNVYPWQLRNKITKLREKYMKIQEEEGDEPILLGPHEREAFELSKKIWGNESKDADDLNEFTEEEKKKG